MKQRADCYCCSGQFILVPSLLTSYLTSLSPTTTYLNGSKTMKDDIIAWSKQADDATKEESRGIVALYDKELGIRSGRLKKSLVDCGSMTSQLSARKPPTC